MDDTSQAAGPAPDLPQLRDVLGRFATGITVISARDESGELLGVTANSFNSVSLDPPLVLFSMSHGLNCYRRLLDAEAYAINVLGSDQRALSKQFATPLGDKWRGVSVSYGVTGAPLIDGALAQFECRPHARHPGGDHTIFVARVVRCIAAGDGEPLVYFRSAYRAIGQVLSDTSRPAINTVAASSRGGTSC